MRLAVITTLLLAVSSSAAPSQPTPRQLINYVMTNTTDGAGLYAEESEFCDDKRALWQQIFADQGGKLWAVLAFTDSNMFESVARSNIERAVSGFSDLRWKGAKWEPFRVLEVDSLLEYNFYVETSVSDASNYKNDYTAVCVAISSY